MLNVVKDINGILCLCPHMYGIQCHRLFLSPCMLQKPLATFPKHRLIREKAHALYTKNAERMIRKHAKNVKTHKFAVGDYASLRIPRIDRTCTDLQRLPCVVVKVIGKAQTMYRLCSKYGVLATCFHAGDLEPFEASYGIPVDGWVMEPRISVREAARLQSPWNSFTKNRCQCKANACDTRRCYCRKNGIECSSHCHKGEGCRNKPCEKENKPLTDEKGNTAPVPPPPPPLPQKEETALGVAKPCEKENKPPTDEKGNTAPPPPPLPQKEETAFGVAKPCEKENKPPSDENGNTAPGTFKPALDDTS